MPSSSDSSFEHMHAMTKNPKLLAIVDYICLDSLTCYATVLSSKQCRVALIANFQTFDEREKSEIDVFLNVI